MAHFDIAFSCVAYLCSALSLLDPSSSEVEHIGSVVKGYHGLMSYATEKWSEHLLAFLDKSGKKIEESSPLYKQVSALCQKHNALKGNGKDRTQMEEDRELTVVKDHRLQYLKDQKDISSLVSRHLGFNRALKDAQKDVGLGMSLYCSISAAIHAA
jgi:hypothetical protein